jgi:hypothetical protein
MDLNLGCGHLSDDEFVAAFEECRLSPAGFHHANRVRLAWSYTGRCDAKGAEENCWLESGDLRRKRVCRKSFNTPRH